jgi:CAAX protease family protein
VSLQPPPRPDLGFPVQGQVPAGVGGGPRWSRLNDRSPAPWGVWTAIGLFLLGDLLVGEILAVAVLAILNVGQLSTSGAAGAPELAATLITDGTLVAVLMGYLVLRVRTWREVLGVPPLRASLREWAVGAAVGLPLYLGIALIVATVLAGLLGGISGKHASTPDQVSSSLSGGGVVLLILVSLVAAPLAEELFFRGFLFRSLRDRHGYWLGALVSSLLFGLAHYVPAPWQDAVLLQATMVFTGLGLATLYEWRGSILANIGAHMAFNTVGVILILATR